MQDSVERFLGALQAESDFSTNTVSAYRNDLTQFVAFLQDQQALTTVTSVEPTHLTSFVLHLRERDYAPSTVARKTAAVKSFFSYLARNGELRSDPSESLASPRVEKYVPKAISEEQIQALLFEPTLGTTADARRDNAMLQVLYSTGMRVTELVSLDVDSVDLDTGTVCCTGKQNRQRHVDLNPLALQTLREYLETARAVMCRNPEEPALFVNHRGHRLTRQGFWLILKQYASKAGIDNITPHTLRHSFAAHQINRGRDLGDVQRILGHVSISTTQVYQRVANQSTTRATDAGVKPRERSTAVVVDELSAATSDS